jgi:N-acyl-D-aspartate/D-glutamate deacylase
LSLFGSSDRGLLCEGPAADIALFDPDTVQPGKESVVRDFPAGGWRIKAPAEGTAGTPARHRAGAAQQLVSRAPELTSGLPRLVADLPGAPTCHWPARVLVCHRSPTS